MHSCSAPSSVGRLYRSTSTPVSTAATIWNSPHHLVVHSCVPLIKTDLNIRYNAPPTIMPTLVSLHSLVLPHVALQQRPLLSSLLPRRNWSCFANTVSPVHAARCTFFLPSLSLAICLIPCCPLLSPLVMNISTYEGNCQLASTKMLRVLYLVPLNYLLNYMSDCSKYWQ